MDIYYRNSKNKKIDMQSWPFMLQTADIFNYLWAYETTSTKKIGGKIRRFSRDVIEKSISITIFANTEEEYSAAINELYDVFEYDVLNRSPGRLFVGDYYLNCYVIGSSKEEWEEEFETMDVKLHFVVEYPLWCKENEFSFVGNMSINFAEYAIMGATDSKLYSRGEAGTLNISVVTKDGVFNYMISTSMISNVLDYYDYLSKRENVWGITKTIELDIFDSSLFDVIANGNYVTYYKELDRPCNGIIFNNILDTSIAEITSEQLNDVDLLLGTEVCSEKSEDAIAMVEIIGSASGTGNFDLISIKGTDKEEQRNTHAYLEQYTHEELGNYTHEELGVGIDKCVISIELTEPLFETDRIFKDNDGVWKLYQNGSSSNLASELQDKLNNFRTYRGTTTIYTNAGNAPTINVIFKSESYYNNVLEDGNCLMYPNQEFVVVNENKMYVRLKKASNYADLRTLYVLSESYFIQSSETDSNTLQAIEDIVNIKNIIIDEFDIHNTESRGCYPYGYPRGYVGNVNAEEISNDSLYDCGFKLILYGPCSDPEIKIAEHTYKVFETLEKEEYIIVDTRNKSLIKYQSDGDGIDIITKRYKEESIFERIPAGKVTILWDKEFGFDLTLIDERSEPKW